MPGQIKYKCNCCGQEHYEWPALAFESPTSYNVLSEITKAKIGELTSDFCIVKHPEQTDRFIRATLTIKVIDHCQELEYGIWVSLSEKSFQNYSENFANPNHETQYFGWFSNDIPEYEIPEGSIPTTVLTRTGGLRPEVIPHQDFDHPLVKDYYDGITKVEAESRINSMLGKVDTNDNSKNEKKPWWRIW